MALFLKYSASLALLAGQVVSQRFVNPPHPIPGQEETTTLFVSGPSGFDSPKNRPINDTSYDWWYFDVVGDFDADGQQPSFAVTFHTSGNQGFDPLHEAIPFPFPSDNFVQIDLAWPNGTIGSWMLFAGEAVITVDGDGASGNFSKTGCSFEGAPDLSEYTVYIDAPEKRIAGSFRIRSVSGARVLEHR